jgi:hypothetical protein
MCYRFHCYFPYITILFHKLLKSKKKTPDLSPELCLKLMDHVHEGHRPARNASCTAQVYSYGAMRAHRLVATRSSRTDLAPGM